MLMLLFLFFCFFFFKQKTAYEMRISDWSSDVCSSDLNAFTPFTVQAVPFINTHHQRPTSLEHEARYVRVLIGNLGLGVQHKQNHIAGFDGLQCLDDGELFNRLEDLAATAQTRGIDQDRKSTRLNSSH